jgi:hypothetical protein
MFEGSGSWSESIVVGRRKALSSVLSLAKLSSRVLFLPRVDKAYTIIIVVNCVPLKLLLQQGLSYYQQLDIQFCLVSFIHRSFQLWVLQGGYNPLLEELIHLLRCASNERTRFQQLVEFILDRIKISVLSHPFNQIVLLSEFFHLVRCFMRQYLSTI